MSYFDILNDQIPLLKLTTNTENIQEILIHLYTDEENNSKAISLLDEKVSQLMKYERTKALEERVTELENTLINQISKLNSDNEDFMTKVTQNFEALQRKIDQNSLEIHQEINERFSKMEKRFEPLLLLENRVTNLTERLERFLEGGDEISKMKSFIDLQERVSKLEKYFEELELKLFQRDEELNNKIGGFNSKLDEANAHIKEQQDLLDNKLTVLNRQLPPQLPGKEGEDQNSARQSTPNSSRYKFPQLSGRKKRSSVTSFDPEAMKAANENSVKDRGLTPLNLNEVNSLGSMDVIVSSRNSSSRLSSVPVSPKTTGRKHYLKDENGNDVEVSSSEYYEDEEDNHEEIKVISREPGKGHEEEYEEEENNENNENNGHEKKSLKDMRKQLSDHETKIKQIGMLLQKLGTNTMSELKKLQENMDTLKDETDQKVNETYDNVNGRISKAEEGINIVSKILQDDDDTAIGQQSCRCLVCGRKTHTAKQSTVSDLQHLTELCSARIPTGKEKASPGAKVTLLIGERNSSVPQTSRLPRTASANIPITSKTAQNTARTNRPQTPNPKPTRLTTQH